MAKKIPEGFVGAVTELCDSYDAEKGEYSESYYEGKALLQHYFQINQKKTQSPTAKEFFMFTPEVAGRWESCLLLSQKLSAEPSKRRCSITSGGVWFNAP